MISQAATSLITQRPVARPACMNDFIAKRAAAELLYAALRR
jgi:hypothetical protein